MVRGHCVMQMARSMVSVVATRETLCGQCCNRPHRPPYLAYFSGLLTSHIIPPPKAFLHVRFDALLRSVQATNKFV